MSGLSGASGDAAKVTLGKKAGTKNLQSDNKRDAWGTGMSENSNTPTSAAERNRRYRKRQRRGQRIIRVQIGPTEIEGLISRGFLGPGDRADTIAIEFGMSAFIDEALGA